jgi:hypothetical protein
MSFNNNLVTQTLLDLGIWDKEFESTLQKKIEFFRKTDLELGFDLPTWHYEKKLLAIIAPNIKTSLNY